MSEFAPQLAFGGVNRSSANMNGQGKRNLSMGQAVAFRNSRYLQVSRHLITVRKLIQYREYIINRAEHETRSRPPSDEY